MHSIAIVVCMFVACSTVGILQVDQVGIMKEYNVARLPYIL